ncbi:MAG: hypothetical protein RSC86_01685, partial [Oscillospiraceae bacterium]
MKLFSEKSNRNKKNPVNTSGKAANSASAKKAPKPQAAPAPQQRAQPARPAPQQRAQSAAAPQKKTGAAKPAGKSKKPIIAIAALIVTLCTVFCIIGAYANGSDTIFPKVSYEGTDLGGMTAAEAADALVKAKVGDGEDKTLVVSLPASCKLEVSAKEAGCYLTAPDAAALAFNSCHGEGFFANTIKFFKCVTTGEKLKLEDGIKLNEVYLREQTDEAVRKVSAALMESDLKIAEDSVTVVKGAEAVQINADDLYKAVKKALTEGR